MRPQLPDLRRVARLLRPLADDGAAELAARWREHALTLLGIVWGAAAVVILLSVGAGFYKNLDLGFKKTGDRYLLAFGQYSTTELGGARPGRAIVFDHEDLARVRAGTPSARWVAAEAQRGGIAARTPLRTRTAVVSAATPELRFIKNHQMARGRFYDGQDQREARPVAVLGGNLPEVFFADRDPLGREIQLDGRPYRVIGVLAKKGTQYVTNNALNDEMIFIPLSQGQRLFGMGDRIETLLVVPRRLDDLRALRAELRAALLPYHRIDPEDKEAVFMMSIPEISRPFLLLALGLELLLGFIGTAVLSMGGVGVANRMVALVNQRKVELAMRRACGARRGDVLLQLLVETLLVVLAGGVLGVALGAGVAAVISALPLPEFIPGPRLEWSVVVTSFSVLTAVGVLAGWVPARAASRVDPGAALRVT